MIIIQKNEEDKANASYSWKEQISGKEKKKRREKGYHTVAESECNPEDVPTTTTKPIAHQRLYPAGPPGGA